VRSPLALVGLALSAISSSCHVPNGDAAGDIGPCAYRRLPGRAGT
jgi:hypothetical protein